MCTAVYVMKYREPLTPLSSSDEYTIPQNILNRFHLQTTKNLGENRNDQAKFRSLRNKIPILEARTSLNINSNTPTRLVN